MKTSLILPCYKRAKLLDVGLASLVEYPTNNLEIMVMNDGFPDDTEEVCNKYKKLGLNIKYIFTGQRNLKETIWRVPGFCLNIGVQQCEGDIIILSCPEILHLNFTLGYILEPLKKNHMLMTIPEWMYFDDNGYFTDLVLNNKPIDKDDYLSLESGALGKEAVTMPFLLGMHKKHFIDIGGYDEDFTGYSADDNDLIERLKCYGLKHERTKAEIVHLYHGKRCDSQTHWNEGNTAWEHNYKLFLDRKGIIKRNIGREWGVL